MDWTSNSSDGYTHHGSESMYDGPLIDEDPKELFTCDGEEWTDHARDLEWVISENL